jgi:hypothetical protein
VTTERRIVLAVEDGSFHHRGCAVTTEKRMVLAVEDGRFHHRGHRDHRDGTE